MDEKKKKIVDIIKPEDIDNVKLGQWMHFICKNCGEDTLLKFATFGNIDRYKRMLCKKCGIKQTCFDRYGVVNPAQLSVVQEKMQQTCLEKYGVVNPGLSPIIKEKRKRTCFKLLGVEYPSQSPEIQEKRKQTCLERYGAECSLLSPEIMEKAQRSMLEHFGCVYPTQSFEVKEKIKQICLKRYGVEYPTQSPEVMEKVQRSVLKHFGCQHPSQSPEVREKYKQTCLERYGVEYLLQLPKFQEKINCKYEYFGLRFDSSWEVYYYVYQTKILKVNCVRNYGEVYFEYSVNGKLHRYIPDFITEGKIVEIKGNHLVDNDNNLINVYRNRDDDILSAKTQCMLDNVDAIITKKEITPMIKEVKRLFGVHYIDQFKVNKDEEGLKAS